MPPRPRGPGRAGPDKVPPAHAAATPTGAGRAATRALPWGRRGRKEERRGSAPLAAARPAPIVASPPSGPRLAPPRQLASPRCSCVRRARPGPGARRAPLGGRSRGGAGTRRVAPRRAHPAWKRTVVRRVSAGPGCCFARRRTEAKAGSSAAGGGGG